MWYTKSKLIYNQNQQGLMKIKKNVKILSSKKEALQEKFKEIT